MTDDGFDCVYEGGGLLAPIDGGVWHVATQRGRTQDFCPIRCSKDEGITFPGGIVRRLPTCPDCRAIVDRTSVSP